jgi:hypothetical protein
MIIDSSVAQRSTSASMQVSVRIVNGTSISDYESLDLNQTIGQINGSSSKNSLHLGHAGFQVKGDPGSQLLVEIPKSVELTDEKGNTVFINTQNLVYWNEADQSSGQGMKHKFEAENKSNVRLNERTGEAYVQFQGVLTREVANMQRERPIKNVNSDSVKDVYIAQIEHL